MSQSAISTPGPTDMRLSSRRPTSSGFSPSSRPGPSGPWPCVSPMPWIPASVSTFTSPQVKFPWIVIDFTSVISISRSGGRPVPSIDMSIHGTPPPGGMT